MSKPIFSRISRKCSISDFLVYRDIFFFILPTKIISEAILPNFHLKSILTPAFLVRKNNCQTSRAKCALPRMSKNLPPTILTARQLRYLFHFDFHFINFTKLIDESNCAVGRSPRIEYHSRKVCR